MEKESTFLRQALRRNTEGTIRIKTFGFGFDAIALTRHGVKTFGQLVKIFCVPNVLGS